MEEVENGSEVAKFGGSSVADCIPVGKNQRNY
jgi:aspartokinase